MFLDYSGRAWICSEMKFDEEQDREYLERELSLLIERSLDLEAEIDFIIEDGE